MEIKRGRLIVIDGPDASGKGTQVERIHRRLLTKGYNAEILDFPQYGQNIFAKTFRDYLRGDFGDPTTVSPYLAATLTAADRWTVKDKINEGLSRGTVFVANRYASSNMGHQGAKMQNLLEREAFMEWNYALEFSDKGFGIPKPDLTVLLDVSRTSSKEMLEARTVEVGGERDGHERNQDYQQRVATTFLEIAQREPSWRVVRCNGEDNKILSPNVITDLIWQTIAPYLPLDTLSKQSP